LVGERDAIADLLPKETEAKLNSVSHPVA